MWLGYRTGISDIYINCACVTVHVTPQQLEYKCGVYRVPQSTSALHKYSGPSEFSDRILLSLKVFLIFFIFYLFIFCFCNGIKSMYIIVHKGSRTGYREN